MLPELPKALLVGWLVFGAAALFCCHFILPYLTNSTTSLFSMTFPKKLSFDLSLILFSSGISGGFLLLSILIQCCFTSSLPASAAAVSSKATLDRAKPIHYWCCRCARAAGGSNQVKTKKYLKVVVNLW